MYSSGFFNPTKDEEAYEPIQSANRRTTIPDFSLIESRYLATGDRRNPGGVALDDKRNTGKRGYRPKQAHIKAERRRQLASKQMVDNTLPPSN